MGAFKRTGTPHGTSHALDGLGRFPSPSRASVQSSISMPVKGFVLIVLTSVATVILAAHTLRGKAALTRGRSAPSTELVRAVRDGQEQQRAPESKLKQIVDPWRCFYIGLDPHASPESELSTRTLCVSGGPMCFDEADYGVVHRFVPPSGAATTCRVLHAADDVRAEVVGAFSADSVCERLFPGFVRSFGKMVSHRDLVWLKERAQRIQWHPPSIIMPRYPYLNNIFHYARGVLFALHAYWNGRVYGFTNARSIHVRTGEVYKHVWSRELSSTVSARLLPVFSLRKRSKEPKVHHCFERALLLGSEGTFDGFQFVNDSAVYGDTDRAEDSHIPPVPVDALRFRNLFYKELGLSMLPSLRGDLSRRRWIDLPAPPLRMAYLIRTPPSKRMFDEGTARRFEAILHDVADEYHIALDYVRFENLTLAEQARRVRCVGLGVGIHGANLQNAIFMPPGAQLFEVFPYHYERSYYVGGSNSGLRYSSHTAVYGKKLYCERYTGRRAMLCRIAYRSKPIHLSSEELVTVKAKLRTAARYLVALNELGPRLWLRRKGVNFLYSRNAIERAMKAIP